MISTVSGLLAPGTLTALIKVGDKVFVYMPASRCGETSFFMEWQAEIMVCFPQQDAGPKNYY